ncbi:MAG: hypothetical protein ACLP8S_15875 [Solirubrobacteraceae bacterium]
MVELTYTLFTPGPDEALDPLMLGLAATLLLLLGHLTNVDFGEAAALLALGLLLAVLFATRLWLAKRSERDRVPSIWWLWRMREDADDRGD